MTSETRHPLPARPGQPTRYDSEYKREGTANLFLFVQPLRGWRQVNVTHQRTKRDFAEQMQLLVDEYFPTAERIRLVVDNLNTHTPAALYGVFPPDEARRIIRKLEFHYTPKHGSWLNMAECEFAVLAGQCLDRRIPNIETLQPTVRLNFFNLLKFIRLLNENEVKRLVQVANSNKKTAMSEPWVITCGSLISYPVSAIAPKRV